MNLNSAILKYKKNYKKNHFNDKLSAIVREFIRENKLLIYGGYAIDKLIKLKSNKKDGLYDFEYDFPDFDVYHPDYDKMANKLADKLKVNYDYVKIVTGITGLTRRIFVNIDPKEVIDISHIDEDFYFEMKTVEIGGFLYCNPDFLKVDQYQNMCIRIYQDNFRLQKSYNKIKLLEKWYPVKQIKSPESIDVIKKFEHEDDIGVSSKELKSEYDPIHGGDYVYSLYYPDEKHSDEDSEKQSEKQSEVILYSNSIIKSHIPDHGILKSPNYRLLPIKESMLCYIRDNGEKIVTKIGLLYQYYYFQYHLSKRVKKQYKIPNNINKIVRLYNDPDTWKFLSTDTQKVPTILYNETEYIKKMIKSLPTQYIVRGSGITSDILDNN